MTILSILIGITGLFIFFLIAKAIFIKINKRFCAICASISMAWIILLALLWLGIFNDKIIIAILIGMTITGLYYLVEKSVKEDILIFRLPFLLSLISLAYYTLQPDSKMVDSLIFLAIIWVLLILVYLYRKNPSINSYVKRLVECCKRW